MKKQKEILKEKLIGFQLKIAELTHEAVEREQALQDREKGLFMNIFEVIDALDLLMENTASKKGELDKTARMLAKSIGTIRKKMIRLLKARNIVQITFEDNKASILHCKVVDTKQDIEKENETILSVVKNGYMDIGQNLVLRKAEVITVMND